MVKPPIVHQAGLLRRIGGGITTTDWAWIGWLSGQQLFYPPNVAGWDDTRWLDTATYRGRWIAVQRLLRDNHLDPAKPPAGTACRRAGPARARAHVLAGTRSSRPGRTTRCCTSRRPSLHDARKAEWKRKQYPVLIENALRHLIAVSPDVQTS